MIYKKKIYPPSIKTNTQSSDRPQPLFCFNYYRNFKKYACILTCIAKRSNTRLSLDDILRLSWLAWIHDGILFSACLCVCEFVFVMIYWNWYLFTNNAIDFQKSKISMELIPRMLKSYSSILSVLYTIYGVLYSISAKWKPFVKLSFKEIQLKLQNCIKWCHFELM